MAGRLVLLLTSPRLPAGLLTADAWDLLRAHPVYATAESPLVGAVRVAGGVVTVLAGGTAERVAALRAAASGATAVWLVSAARADGTASGFGDGAAAGGTPAGEAAPGGDDDVVRALAARLAAGGGEGPALEVVYGSWDPPGARLLDVVAVMDRLRSPGGCPWDAEQTHDSLRPYLLEEAYEAYDALVDADSEALREELGDVLLQVAFHARLAEEGLEDGRWSIDDVAGDLVDKLVRRHPHVFADRVVSGADEVNANWEQIKHAEKRRESVLDGVARSQPALALAAKYLSRVARASLDVPPPPLPAGLDIPVGGSGVGDLLLALVAAAGGRGVDAEAALRAAAHAYAARVRAAERAAAAPADRGPA